MKDSCYSARYIKIILPQDNEQLLGDCKLITDAVSKLDVESWVSSQLELSDVAAWQSDGKLLWILWSTISEVEWLPPVPSLADRDLDDCVRTLESEDEDAWGVTVGAGCLDVMILFNAPNCAWHTDIKGRYPKLKKKIRIENWLWWIHKK